MDALLRLLEEEVILLLMILLAVGSVLGAVRFKRVQLGPAAVLFAAIGIASLGATKGFELQVPEEIGILGLVLFTYTVGVVSGPSFFASLRRGWAPMLAVLATFVTVGGVGIALGRLFGLTSPVIAGTFAGALTNTPALAAATQRSGDTVGPTIGYSIAYLYGVIGMLAVSLVVLRQERSGEKGDAPLTNQTVRVDRDDLTPVGALVRRYSGQLVVSRLRHGEESPIELPSDWTVLQKGDLVGLVGPEDVVAEVAERLGHVSSHELVEHGAFDYRRITLSNPKLAGRTLGEIGIDETFGANVTRVRRGDVDLVAHEQFVTQLGDRLRVIAPRRTMGAVTKHLGDSERGLSDINPIGFALGLAIGVAVGIIEIPVPGGSFALGAAAGTLLVGLVFGRMGRIGPIVVSMPNSAANTLSVFGMLTFLAYAGSRAGQGFAAAISSDLGWKIAVIGLAMTTLAAVILAGVGRWVLKMDPRELAGVIAGSQTQPAVLAFANERTGFDTRVGLGYALVFPAAMIAKIMLAQVIAVL
ncbi:aspartate:alanine exchanger family transporter [Janibacter sp. GXQ6167]|uniref:aspartate:alanine exchanger family transporter n=1 Tax=Janibacter sp. GXQ6167 TaxID=3240791 RepID=UPI003526AA82